MIDRGRRRKARGRRLFRFPSRHCCHSSLLPPLAHFCFPLRLFKLVIVSVYMKESERQRRNYWFGKSASSGHTHHHFLPFSGLTLLRRTNNLCHLTRLQQWPETIKRGIFSFRDALTEAERPYVCTALGGRICLFE